MLHLVLALAGSAATPMASEAVASKAPSCVASGEVTPICGLTAPEDMELLPDGRTMLVGRMDAAGASSAAGGVSMLDLATRTTKALPVTVAPKEGWGEPGCAAPTGQPVSHGINIVRRDDGALALLVVNHGGRESVEFLELTGSGMATQALWRGCVIDRLGMLNDVAGTRSGGFYATHMLDQETQKDPEWMQKAFDGRDTGQVVRWISGGTIEPLPGTAASINNGLVLSPDEKSLIFAAYGSRQIRRYDLAREKVTANVALPFYPDNFSRRVDGKLLSTGMEDLAPFRACTAAGKADCRTAFAVAVVAPEAMSFAPLYHGAAGQIMGASVAVQAGEMLYVGGYTGDRVIEVRLKDAGRER